MAKGSRQFFIMQYEKHPETGETLLTEDTIKTVVGRYKTIKQYAYICHDKDLYSEEDEINNPDHKQGTAKPRHWHIALKCGNAVEIGTIAKWFGIAENFINYARGAGAFMDCVEYLTHEAVNQQAKGKHRYEDEEVCSNFDWREALTKRAARKAMSGGEIEDEKEFLRSMVFDQGWSIRQVIDFSSSGYQADFSTLDRLRAKYISMMPPATTRITYYVDGPGGIGKGLMSVALARALYPDMKHDDDIYYKVGAKGAAFEGYDGQPVLIWDDRRAIDFLEELGGRGNVFNVFDSHPSGKQRQNIKYGSISLPNEVHIINGIQPFNEFLDGLAGEYKDKHGNLVKSELDQKSQVYRRMQIIICIHENDFDILMNKGFMQGTREYTQYMQYKTVRGNMGVIAAKCKNNRELAKDLQNQMVQPIVDKHRELYDIIEGQAESEDVIKAWYNEQGYGQSIIKLDLEKTKEMVTCQRDRHFKAQLAREGQRMPFEDGGVGAGSFSVEKTLELYKAMAFDEQRSQEDRRRAFQQYMDLSEAVKEGSGERKK